jgi:hypothetical protein
MWRHNSIGAQQQPCSSEEVAQQSSMGGRRKTDGAHQQLPCTTEEEKGEGENGCTSSRGCYGREESMWELTTMANQAGDKERLQAGVHHGGPALGGRAILPCRPCSLHVCFWKWLGGTTTKYQKILIWGAFLLKLYCFSHPSRAYPTLVPAGPTVNFFPAYVPNSDS